MTQPGISSMQYSNFPCGPHSRTNSTIIGVARNDRRKILSRHRQHRSWITRWACFIEVSYFIKVINQAECLRCTPIDIKCPLKNVINDVPYATSLEIRLLLHGVRAITKKHNKIVSPIGGATKTVHIGNVIDKQSTFYVIMTKTVWKVVSLFSKTRLNQFYPTASLDG